jgi:hypothetical protein
MALAARLATEANGLRLVGAYGSERGVLAKYVEAGRPSVTQQAESYPPVQ